MYCVMRFYIAHVQLYFVLCLDFIWSIFDG